MAPRAAFLVAICFMLGCSGDQTGGIERLTNAHSQLMLEFNNDDWIRDNHILIPDVHDTENLSAEGQSVAKVLQQAVYGDRLQGAYEVSFSRTIPPLDNVSVRVFEFKTREAVESFTEDRLGDDLENYTVDDGKEVVTLTNDRTGKVIKVFGVYYVSVFRLGNNTLNPELATRFADALKTK
ncbi:MAG: hypothetical protein AAF438_03925 [Pseudomonadota bacterium]